MTNFLAFVSLVILGGYSIAKLLAWWSCVQDEREYEQSVRLVELSSRYDYRTNRFNQ